MEAIVSRSFILSMLFMFVSLLIPQYLFAGGRNGFFPIPVRISRGLEQVGCMHPRRQCGNGQVARKQGTEYLLPLGPPIRTIYDA